MNDPRVEAVTDAITYHPGNRADFLVRQRMSSLFAKAAIEAADRADREAGIHRVRVDGATVERVAEVAALVDDLDGCFERIREYEAMEDWEKDAQGYPSDDYESRADWIKRTQAVLDALTEPGAGE